MKIMKTLLFLVIIAVGVLGYLTTQQPDEMKVTRSITINAAPEAIFKHVNNLELGQKWSPWVEMDPDAKYEFEGPKSGKGAILKWDGKKTGKGLMTIVESRAPEYVRSDLEFIKPMASTSTAEFKLEPRDQGTEVTWTMEGKNNLMAKFLSIFMDCEKIAGEQFDKGLINLKNIIEKN